MANYLKENPLYIDAPVNLQPPQYGKIFVKEVRWEDYIVGNALVVSTGTGGTIINETIQTGDTDLGVIRFGPFGWVNGFNVTTISGGNITVTVTKS